MLKNITILLLAGAGLCLHGQPGQDGTRSTVETRNEALGAEIRELQADGPDGGQRPARRAAGGGLAACRE
ncbi:MAG: hypothetical protein U1F87_09030 [Kiritimatiellia bacterium]